MNNTFKANLIKTLANKKGNKGFTLIELLVVVIIIGVLAAIALPNLLGQVGKARESEAKSQLGAMNRAQQANFTERGAFADTFDVLEVPVGNEKFYGIFMGGTPGQVGATGVTREESTQNITAVGAVPNGANGTRDYVAGINYDNTARSFTSVVCRAMNRDDQYVLTAATAEATSRFMTDSTEAILTGITSGGVVDADTIAACDPTNTEETR